MKLSKEILGGVLVTGFVLLQFGTWYLDSRNVKATSYSVFSTSATGLSLFSSMAKALERQVLTKNSAFLHSDDLKNTELLLIYSPLMKISRHEAEVIQEFAADGGTVVLGFHDKESLKNLENLTGLFYDAIDIEEDSSFSNGHVTEIQQLPPMFARNNTIDPGSTSPLSVYSLYTFTNCLKSTLSCYLKEQPVGNGRVLLWAGVPVLANALIIRGQNSLFAREILENFNRILVDEYHHFHTDKTTLDLLLEPVVSLPLLSLIVGAVVFFIYGFSSLHRSEMEDDAPKESQVSSFHQHSHSIVTGLLERTIQSTPAFVESSLNRLFPSQHARISKFVSDIDGFDSTKKVAFLMRLHHELLEEQQGTHRRPAQQQPPKKLSNMNKQV